MGTISEKLTYLNTTKSQLKDMINYGLDDNDKITSSTTFREYVSSIFNAFLEALRTPDTLFTNLPKKSGTGANITLNDTANAPMRITLESRALEQVTTTGKNLLSNIQLTASTTKNGVTFTPVFDENGLLEYVSVNGTATEQITQAIGSFVPEVGISYKVNGSPTNSSMSNAYVYVTGSISSYGGNDTSASWSTAGEKSYQIIVINGATINNMKFYPMIRLATETDATYEPYTGGIASPNSSYPQTIHTISGDNSVKVENKNWFNLVSDNLNASWDGGNGNKITIIDSKTLKTTADYNTWRAKSVDVKNLLPNTTYTLSLKMSATTSTDTNKGVVRIAYNNGSTNSFITFSDDTDVSVFNSVGQTRNITFTTPNDMVYIGISFNSMGSGKETTFTDIQLELGSSATSGVTHDEQVVNMPLGDLEVCKIGNYEDEFYLATASDTGLTAGKWYLYKKTGKYNFTGQETWSKSNGYTTTNTFTCYTNEINPAPKITTGSLGGYYNRGFVDDIAHAYDNYSSFFGYNSNRFSMLGIPKNVIPNWDESMTDADKITLFKQYLTNNLCTIIYVLETPTYTLLNDTLQNALNTLQEKLLAYKGQTNISQVNNDLPFTISASALKDLSNL